MAYEGGCPCGAVRYRIEGEPLSAGYCHCRMCRNAAGAPAVSWVAFHRDDFHVVKGKPHASKVSERVTRLFCADCGTALTFEYSATRTIDVTISSLDSIEPLYEIWSSGKPPWLHIKQGSSHFSRDAPACPK